MRKILLFITKFLFGISASIFLLLLLLGLLFKTPKTIETALARSLAYETVSSYVNKNVAANIAAPKAITTALNQEFSAKYIQTKTEKFLQAIYDYTEGRTNALPSTNLSDLKNNLIRRVPTFAYIARQYTEFFDQEFRVSQDRGEILKYYYNAYLQTLAASFIASMLLFFAIFFLGKDEAQRLKLMARELLKLGLPGLIGAIIALAILSRAPMPNFNVPDTIGFLKEPITHFSVEITERLLAVSILMYGWIALIGLLFHLAGHVIKAKNLR